MGLGCDPSWRQSLEQRKFKLHRLLAYAAPGLVFNDWIDGSEVDVATVFEHARSLGLEGIVSKRKKDLRYVSGRSPYWLKRQFVSEAARREAEEDWGQ